MFYTIIIIGRISNTRVVHPKKIGIFSRYDLTFTRNKNYHIIKPNSLQIEYEKKSA